MTPIKAKEIIKSFYTDKDPRAEFDDYLFDEHFNDWLKEPTTAAMLSGDGLDTNWKENFKEWYYATEEERSDIVSAEQCVEWIEKNIIGLSGEDWISVKDRLPDIIEHFGLSNEVLAFYEWDKSFDVDMLCKDGTWYSGRTPTHWQPLPKAPQNG